MHLTITFRKQYNDPPAPSSRRCACFRPCAPPRCLSHVCGASSRWWLCRWFLLPPPCGPDPRKETVVNSQILYSNIYRSHSWSYQIQWRLLKTPVLTDRSTQTDTTTLSCNRILIGQTDKTFYTNISPISDTWCVEDKTHSHWFRVNKLLWCPLHAAELGDYFGRETWVEYLVIRS